MKAMTDEIKRCPLCAGQEQPWWRAANNHSIRSLSCFEKVEKEAVEYFNTFGGNPAWASIGLAILNVIKEERLQENALEVGTYLKTKFRQFQSGIQIGTFKDNRKQSIVSSQKPAAIPTPQNNIKVNSQ
jgi:hypothetical protein